METIQVYVRGDAHTPERFWHYALRTSCEEDSVSEMYANFGFKFSQKDTDLFKSLTEEQKNKVNFLYVNGMKDVRYSEITKP
jgi:hypothetical protein